MKITASRFWLGTLLLLDALGLGYVSLVIFRVSGGSGRPLLMGLSAQSLALVGLTLVGAFGFLALGLLILRGKLSVKPLPPPPAWSIGLLASLAITCWLLAWTPPDYFKSYYYYALRFIPLAGWLAFASGSFALFLFASQHEVSMERAREYLRQNRAIFLVSAMTLLIIGLIAWLASQRIVGMNPEEEDFWYGAGVPVLAWQVLTAILAGLGAAWTKKKFLRNGTKNTAGRVPVDVFAFVILWTVTGLLWAQAPIATNFLISQPYPPNFEYYPAADGENYDLASQYALIGQGLFNAGQMRIYFERPLYSAFLFYLHLLAGQDFTRLLNLQAFLYGVFPALAYLIGKSLHSRTTGAALAVLLALRGINGLETGGILDNATQKMFLTEFPTAIGLALILVLAIRWAQQPQGRWRLAGWIGGCIGLWGFARPHIAFLLPVAISLAAGLYFRRKRSAAALSGFVLLAYLAAVMPWIQFNGSGMSLVDMYLWRAQAIIQERFHRPPQPGGSLAPRQVASLGLPGDFLEMRPKPLPEFALDHLLNNLALSTLALPATLQNLDLVTIVKQTETYWNPYWDGALSPSARILLLINVMFIALGVGAAWRRARLIGLFPLLGMLIYFTINSLVRTSGGRYLAPADWVVVLYYILGLMALLEFGAAWLGERYDIAAEVLDDRPKPAWHGLVVLAAIAAMGSLIPLTNLLNPPRYERLDTLQITAKLDSQFLAEHGITDGELQSFLEQEQAFILEGRALYPRHIWRGVNPRIPGHLLSRKPYSRMAFTAIGRHGHLPVVLVTGDEWFDFPHTADVFVIGCREDEFLDAWAVILPEIAAVYVRQPETPPHCPLPEPVCDNNGWCRYE